MGTLYRIWAGSSDAGGGDRREIGRAKAHNIDAVVELVKTEYLKEDTTWDETGEEDNLILMLHICKGCPWKKEELNGCEECQRNEYIEIDRDPETEPSFKLITGENYFWDLTGPEPVKSPDHPIVKVLALMKHTDEHRAQAQHEDQGLDERFEPEI